MHYLTVATCIKGEDDYIDDFIMIHEKLGVESFIFFDRDDDNLTKKFQGRDNIHVVKYKEPLRHHEAHLHVVKHHGLHAKWIALIDCDQVLFPVQTKDLHVALREYEQYAQVQPVWHTFGSNGLKTKTDGSVYERFTRRAVDEEGINNHSQSIVQPTRIELVLAPDPHRQIPKRGEISVDENCKQVGDHNRTEALIIPHSQNKLFVAHYILKSREEYITKQNKNRADTGTRMNDLFDEQNRYCNAVEDTRIRDYWLANCK